MSRRGGLLGLFAWRLLAAAPALAQPPMWTVSGAGSTLVLFGSVHLLPPGLDWRPPSLTQALAKADEVWFELPVNDATDAVASSLALERGAFPPGDDLFKHLTALQGDRLRRAAQSLGLSAPALAGMRPWLAEVTLSLAADMRAGAQPGQGVEEALQTSAPATAVRRAFETPGQQIGYLAGAAMADQIASLDETLTEIADRPDAYRQLVDEWMAGDLAGLQADALEPLRKASPALYRRLMTDRNRRWAAALQQRLTHRGVIVVIVGMGHLIGPDGVPALLRAKGFKVDGP